MGTPKQREKKKKGGCESIPSMNYFRFMEINDSVDFLYSNCFVALHRS
jgi:hypothetical protein